MWYKYSLSCTCKQDKKLRQENNSAMQGFVDNSYSSIIAPRRNVRMNRVDTAVLDGGNKRRRDEKIIGTLNVLNLTKI